MNMDPHVRFPGQSYERFLVGRRLTDRDIHRYALAGRYGPELQKLAQKKALKPKTKLKYYDTELDL